MQEENTNQPEKSRGDITKRLLDIAKEKLNELDSDQLEKLAGGVNQQEAIEDGSGKVGCSCYIGSC
ncbi:MAG TPA: hypothetical protein VGN64_01760 [Dyadobacter sp.]|uniref:Uncharacterized protein n=1 Tax=Dyadobacter luteus TaxID=2259619 RepID=A0A3D8YFU4_9BACT|nr:hypothetical protein [Dyadobacter luteus]REA63531.1 hypothetical protein DSL64_03550 [Dyadobacter luteus]HEV7378493.1 hypothetical protein [Dyadobacter sp.]